MDDETLVAMAQNGDSEAANTLVGRYESLAQFYGRKFFIQGGDREDVIQEARLAIWTAIQSYNAEAGAAFKTFVNLVVSRRILTAVKFASRKKHQMLSGAVSLDATFSEDENGTLADVIPSGHDFTENVSATIDREAIKEALCSKLSDLEKQVLLCYLEGKSLRESAFALNRCVKSIDNALTRMKGKLAKVLEPLRERAA